MEKMWQPQRSNKDHAVALFKNLTFIIKYPVSRSTIETDVESHPEFPGLSLEAMIAILGKWGLKAVAIEFPEENLAQLDGPIIFYIEEDNGDYRVGNFVILHQIKGETIEYLHTRMGWVIESVEDFKKKWAKVIVVLTGADRNGEEDFAAKETAYFEAQNNNPERKNVRIHDDFLTDEECEYIINLSTEKFNRSGLMGNTIETGHGRTSYTANLVFPEDEKLNKIRSRASELLGLPESHFEYFQCVSYECSQEYQNHFDTFDESSELGRKAIEEGGQRKYTMLAYLNDDFVGGSTHFPNLDLKIEPKKRRVVIFNNLDDNGNVIPAAYHAGLPVSSGRKYAINMWVRSKPLKDR